MGFSYGPTTNWAISGGAGLGLVPVAGISAYAITLLDVDNQIFFPGWLAGSSVGGGLKAGGTVSTFSATFFTVSVPIYASDFDNSICSMLDASLVVIVGGGYTGMTIWGISHTPSVINIGGLGAGLSAGITLSPLMYMRIDSSSAWQNTGCRISPDGDGLCGGYSAPEDNFSDGSQDMSY